MSRYFFHLKGSITVDDDEGVELPGEVEARLEAVRFGGSMLRNFPGYESWTVIVKDDSGASVTSLLFAAQPIHTDG